MQQHDDLLPHAAPLRLGVWAGDGNNTHFLDPILKRLPARYHVVRMGNGGSPEQIEADLKTVDVAWFEWAVGPAAVGSQHSADVPTLVRLHRYEAYTDWPRQIAWRNVDGLVFVSPGVERSFNEMHGPDLLGTHTRTHVVPNGLDVDDYPFSADKKRGYDLAFVGRMHLVKNPMLLVQLMAALVKRDARYTLHLAGDTQHVEVYRYLRYHTEQLGLEKHVKIYGHLDAASLRAMLQKCSYLVSTSVIEGHPVGVMEGMAMGLKPVLHDFYGARDLFPSELLWNTTDEAVRLVTRGSFEPAAYRQFVADHYSLDRQVEAVVALLDRTVAQYQPARVAALLAVPAHVTGDEAAARVARAHTLADAERYADALAALAGVDFTHFDGEAHVAARVLGARLALACGDATEALRHADALTDLAPDEPLALNLAGRALWEAGQYEAALHPLVAAAEAAEGQTGWALAFDADALQQDAADACAALGKPFALGVAA